MTSNIREMALSRVIDMAADAVSGLRPVHWEVARRLVAALRPRRAGTGRPRVVVESPCSGDMALHKLYALACLRDSFQRGEDPYASHVLLAFSGVLDDTVDEERREGMECGFSWAAAGCPA